MKRMLKTAGVALLAALVLGAFGASAAQASTLYTNEGKYPAAITGVQLGAQVMKVHVGAGNNEIKCNKLAMSGTLSEGSSSLTVHPEYTECTAFGVAAVVNTTNCNFVFHFGENKASEEYYGTTDVECTAGQFINVVTAACEIRIFPQNGVGTMIWTDSTAAGKVLGTFALANFAYTVSKDGAGCPLTGLENRVDGTYKNSSFQFTATVGGVAEKITVS